MIAKSRLYAVSFGEDRVKVGMTGSFWSRRVSLEAAAKRRVVDFIISPYLPQAECRLAEAQLIRILREVLLPWRGSEWFKGEFRLVKRVLVRHFVKFKQLDGEWQYERRLRQVHGTQERQSE